MKKKMVVIFVTELTEREGKLVANAIMGMYPGATVEVKEAGEEGATLKSRGYYNQRY